MNKNRLAIIPILFLMAVVFVGTAAAQTAAPVEATLTAPPGDYKVGDSIQLILSVTHPAEFHVLAPELEENWGDFIVKSVGQPTTTPNPNGSETTALLIDARLFAPGTFNTPPLTVTIADDGGGLQEVVAPAVPVSIGSVLVEGDEVLRDIKPQAELPYLNLVPYLMLGLIAALVLGAFALWRRRRLALAALAAIDNRLPHEVALDELDRIYELGLPEAGRFKEYYTLVSDCIRVYMEKTYHIPVLERTTSEIQTSLKGAAIDPETGRQFVSLLADCDLVKFSTFKPDVPNAYHVLNDSRQIVEDTRPITIDESQAEADDPMNQPPNPEFSTNGSQPKTEVIA